MREISQEALAAACEEKVKQLEFSVKQSAFDSVRQELETELQIARVALAALREQAEPVAYISKADLDAGYPHILARKEYSKACPMAVYSAPPAPSHENVHYADAAEEEIAALRKRIAELETAQPATVVDDFERWFSQRRKLSEINTDVQYRLQKEAWEARAAKLDAGAQVVPDELVYKLLDIAKRAAEEADECANAEFSDNSMKHAREIAEWERRAAMLSLVAAGWIACSERMPEKDGNYWAWWSESKRQGPAWFIKSELQAQFQSSEITHWMPLPEAPGKEG